MGYTKDAFQGFRWMGAFRVLSRVGAFVKTAILARILLPSQFGLFGIASLVLIFLETITESGINVFLVQENKELEEYVDSAWVISITRGIVITLLIFIFASLISHFFKAHESLNLIRMMGLVSLIRGFINPSRVRYLKNLEFKNEFKFSLSIFFIDASVSVVLALVLRSPVSLIYGLIAGAFLEMTLSNLIIKPKPKLILNIKQFKNIIERGRWVTGSTLFSYFFEQGDDIVVGRVMNTTSLGIYQVAYKVGILPITEVSQLVNQVIFPIYSKFAHDKIRLKRAFLKTIFSVGLLELLLSIIVFIFPKAIILILLGRNWLGAVGVLRILSVFGFIRAITLSTNPLFQAAKKQEFITYFTFISLVIMAVTIVPFVLKLGLVGAGYSVVIGAVSAIPVTAFGIYKVFENEKS